MAWIKISDEDGGVYALEPDPDPAVVVSIEELEAEIKELQARIDGIRLIEIPNGASEELLRLAEDENAKKLAGIAAFQEVQKYKQDLLSSLRGL